MFTKIAYGGYTAEHVLLKAEYLQASNVLFMHSFNTETMDN